MLAQAGGARAWAFKQTMLAVATFLLAAASLGLDTLPMEGFVSPDAVRDAVGLPARYAVPVVVAVGHAAAPRDAAARASPRRAVGEAWFGDAFGRPLEEEDGALELVAFLGS